ncbi:hypothetical protein [Pseudodonghicola flavimaris]|uniref:Uncharacterized protein n=1 Tax=Pseudodonghicola flavimaris TaxID=3050036 RepID=A0ABT7EVE3_9RHOB|nr:hypothetical protein [Pseudodonghicola flavimaris]MDK3016306.1 hypothetical protein [Pseudodonghicola flavimaris]
MSATTPAPLSPERAALEDQLLAAHTAGDKGRLIGLYCDAAHGAATEDERWFFLTQAYVFALDKGDARAASLQRQLAAAGRES